jgi:hypothetical protein
MVVSVLYKGIKMNVAVNGKNIEQMESTEICDLLPPSEGGLELAQALLTVKRLVAEMNSQN